MNERFARAGALARIELGHEPDFGLGRIQVRPSRREIVGIDVRETVEPRVMQVLVALVRAKGEILTRDDLIESCWDGVIVGEDAINRCVGRLRKVAEASGNVFSIETIPRVSYRLKVTEASVAVSEPASVEVGRAHPQYVVAASTGPRSVAVTREPGRTAHANWILLGSATVLMVVAIGFVLWWFWPRTANMPAAQISIPPANSVAVLPFANMSGDAKQEYFSDGFSEELLNVLSSNPHLRVPARTSSFSFKGKNADLGVIARTLGVRSIIEGSVREWGNRVRINAQLIDTQNGYSIWSANYDRNVIDILSVQDDIARAISASLTNQLIPKKMASVTAMNAEAYRAYLQGQAFLYPRTADGAAGAIPSFKKAISLQPGFADAYARLARAYVFLEDFSSNPDRTRLPAAEAAARRALQLSPDDLGVLADHLHVSLELLDWAGATADVIRMQEVNPRSAVVLQATYRYYHFLGFPERALAAARGAVELDPLSIVDRLNLGTALMDVGHYAEAAAQFEVLLAQHPDHPVVRRRLCNVYAVVGQLEKAQLLAHWLTANQPEDEAVVGCNVSIAVAMHRRAEAEAIVDRWIATTGKDRLEGYAADLGLAYMDAASYSKALFWLNRAYDDRLYELFLFEPSNKSIPRDLFKQPGWLALMDKPRMREWKTAHDEVAAELENRGLQDE